MSAGGKRVGSGRKKSGTTKLKTFRIHFQFDNKIILTIKKIKIMKILVGGQALRNLGSDRHTNDVDYLVNDLSSTEAFICSENEDLLNANGNKFFAEIFAIENGNVQATPQSLFELKAYAFVQHCQNFNFAKADACEYDLKFLVRNFGCTPNIVKKHITSGELSEIVKIVNSVK